MTQYYGNPNFSWSNDAQIQNQYANPNHHQMMTLIEPYMYQTLLSLINQNTVVETDKGTLRGNLVDVKIDHLTLEISGNLYFIRMQEISWVMPTQYHDSK